MPFEFGEVVLVPFPFPFTNQAASKKRPAVIVSNRAYNDDKTDVVLMAITSQLRPSPALGEVFVNRTGLRRVCQRMAELVHVQP